MEEAVKPLIDGEDVNLIPDKDVSLIRIKLGKSHRKESDWTMIKDLLQSHDILTIEPAKETPGLRCKEHLLLESGCFMIFTNMEDCQEYIRLRNRMDDAEGRMFKVSALPFELAVMTAMKYKTDLLIDLIPRKNAVGMRLYPARGYIECIHVL